MPPASHPDAASYTASGFGTKIGWGSSPALLLIDVCQAYWTPGSPLDISGNPASASVLASLSQLLRAARKGNRPIIWTAVEYADMSEAGIFWLKSKSLDVWQVGDARGYGAWMEGLVPGPGEVVVKKKYPSAFFGTELVSRLEGMGVDTVVVGGVSTSGCVRASALDAMQYGFRPMVVPSACGDRSKAVHDANIFDMNAKMADAVDEEEAISHLARGSMS